MDGGEERGVGKAGDGGVLGGRGDQVDACPPLFGDLPLDDGEHSGRVVDADDRAGGADAVEQPREAQARSAADVEHGVAGLQPERVDQQATPALVTRRRTPDDPGRKVLSQLLRP